MTCSKTITQKRKEIKQLQQAIIILLYKTINSTMRSHWNVAVSQSHFHSACSVKVNFYLCAAYHRLKLEQVDESTKRLNSCCSAGRDAILVELNILCADQLIQKSECFNVYVNNVWHIYHIIEDYTGDYIHISDTSGDSDLYQKFLPIYFVSQKGYKSKIWFNVICSCNESCVAWCISLKQ